MNPDQFLYTLPQWIIFAGFIAFIYGFIEKKTVFKLTGIVIFILLGLYAAWAIYSGYFSSHRFLTPEEIINEELEETVPGDIPLTARLFPAYIFFLFSGLAGIPALIFEIKNMKWKTLIAIISAIFAICGFFIIVRTLRTL